MLLSDTVGRVEHECCLKTNYGIKSQGKEERKGTGSWLFHGGLFLTGTLLTSVKTNWIQITWTASAVILWIPCKETENDCSYQKTFLLYFLSV